jgi:Fur family transcriptional regulator, peroxide stress response regulator
MIKSERSPSEERLERLKEAAKAAGIKLTHQRLEIFKELAASEDHPDAETLYRAVQQRVPTVSLDTVYRTLWTLHGLGVVKTLGPRRDAIRFDANLDRHHHFVCMHCGLVRDFQSTALNSLKVPEAVEDFGTMVDAQVEVRGICAKCQQEGVAQPGAAVARAGETSS